LLQCLEKGEILGLLVLEEANPIPANRNIC
jgi:hypothetical protein